MAQNSEDVQHAGHRQCTVHKGIGHVDAGHVVACTLLCQLDAVHDEEDGKSKHTDRRQNICEKDTLFAQLFIKHRNGQMLVLAHHQHAAQQAQPYQTQQGERLAPHGRMVHHITPKEDKKDHRYQSSQDQCADMAQKLEQHGVDLFPNSFKFVHNRLLDCSFF